jgi:hypothetical protein
MDTIISNRWYQIIDEKAKTTILAINNIDY